MVVRRRLRLSHRRAQLGVTLLEALLGLAIIGGVFFGLAQLQVTQSTDIRTQAAANQMRIIKESAERYLATNYTTISDWVLASGTNGSFVQYDNGGGMVNIETDMVNSGFVPPAMTVGGQLRPNPYNQPYEVHFRPIIGAGPVVNGIEALVITAPNATSIQIDPDAQARIAGLIGAQGGAICDQPGNVPRLPNCGANDRIINGAYGGFNVDLTAYGTIPAGGATDGVAAFAYYGEGAALNDYLYRYNIGTPTANTMFTDLLMDGDTTESNRIVFSRRIGLAYEGSQPPGSGATASRELVIQDCVPGAPADFPTCDATNTRFRFDVGRDGAGAGNAPVEFAVLNTANQEVLNFSGDAVGTTNTLTMNNPTGTNRRFQVVSDTNSTTLGVQNQDGSQQRFEVTADQTTTTATVRNPTAAQPNGGLDRFSVAATQNSTSTTILNPDGTQNRVELLAGTANSNEAAIAVNANTGVERFRVSAIDSRTDVSVNSTAGAERFGITADAQSGAISLRDGAGFSRFGASYSDATGVASMNLGGSVAPIRGGGPPTRFVVTAVEGANANSGVNLEGNPRIKLIGNVQVRADNNNGPTAFEFADASDQITAWANTDLRGPYTASYGVHRFIAAGAGANPIPGYGNAAVFGPTDTGNTGRWNFNADTAFRSRWNRFAPGVNPTDRVVWDSQNDQMRYFTGSVQSMEGNSRIQLNSGTRMDVGNNADLNINSGGDVIMQSGSRFYMQSGSRFDMQGNSSMFVNADRVFLTNRSNASLESVLPNYVFKASYYVGPNNNVPKPSCPGGTPAIFIDPQVQFSGTSGNIQVNVQGEYNTFFLTSAVQNSYVYATNFGSYWRVRNGFDVYIRASNANPLTTIGSTGSIGNFRALARTYCYYP